MSLSLLEIAAEAGMTARNVRRRMAQGDIAPDEHGKFDLDDLSVLLRGRRVAEARDRRSAALLKVRAEEMVLKAQAIEAQMAELQAGSAHRAEAIEVSLQAARQVRQCWRDLPSQADQLVALTPELDRPRAAALLARIAPLLLAELGDIEEEVVRVISGVTNG